ncbi:MAG: efflux transporter outer membrane subunit [Sulfuritalea sp.]|nr:efflux transporter outer membrane subunit [Sulfuritalea sp.]
MSSSGCGIPAISRRARYAAVGLVIAVLGGCAQLGGAKNEEQMSSIPIPAAWSRAGEASKTASATSELQRWWRRLDDPLLDQLIAAAMTAAPDLRTAQAKLRQARASRDLAVGNLYPSLGVSASANRSKTGTVEARTQYAAGFDASWEPSIFGGKRDAAAGAQADLAASEATLAAAQVSLAAEVALEYVTLRVYQRRLAIARDNTASQAETLQITDWRQQAGLATMLNVEQARTNLEQTRAAIPGLETGRAQAEHRLAVLTGQVPGAWANRLREAKPLPRAPEDVAVGIPADTIRQRPDVRAAELTLQAEVARSAEQEAALYPGLTLSGSWGWTAFSSAALGGGDTLVRSLAGSLAATLFDGGRIRARIAVQDAMQERALVTYEASILSALEEVENALVAYAAGRERLDTQRRAAESARSAAQLARTLYEAGSVDFQQVLDTGRTRLSAEDGLASAESDLLAAVIKLYKALGGGWQPTGDTAAGTSRDARS